jgi:hypothetical protein
VAGPAAHRRTEARTFAVACAAAVALAGCGGSSNERQDENEPEGNFPVEVVDASFPVKQKLAKRSQMRIEVRNAGQETIPNIAVTVKCREDERGGSGGSASGAGGGGGFSRDTTHPGVADPERPQFVVNTIPTRTSRPKGRQVELDPLERSSAYVDTYPLGKLRAGQTVEFVWDVSAVKAGGYRLCWEVAAGLDGKAKAVPANGSRIRGVFAGRVSDEAPDARIAEDGETVVNEPPEARP